MTTQKPIQWPSQPLPEEHTNCGTDECCGECSTPDKEEELVRLQIV